MSSQTTSNIGSLGTLRYTFSSGDGVILDASPKHGAICMRIFRRPKEWARVNVAPIPEMNALFPIIGFFAAQVNIAVFGGGDGNCRFRFFAKSNGVVLQTIPRHA